MPTLGRSKIIKGMVSMIRLTERERQVLLMRNEGHTFDEIAKAIGVATGTARTIWNRARIKLKYLKTKHGGSKNASSRVFVIFF